MRKKSSPAPTEAPPIGTMPDELNNAGELIGAITEPMVFNRETLGMSDTVVPEGHHRDANGSIVPDGFYLDDKGLLKPVPPKRAGRKKREEDPDERIDLPKVLADPGMMNYTLLLALLLKSKGSVKFTAKDLQVVDTDFNVLFAVTADGKNLEVSVVSAQSGIIRSPEHDREAQQQAAEWLRQQQGGVLSGYNPPPSAELVALAQQRAEMHQQKLREASPESFPSGMMPDAESAEARFLRIAQSESPQPAATQTPNGQPASGSSVIAFPGTGAGTRTDQASDPSAKPNYVFPFDVGANPKEAGHLDLNSLQAQLLGKGGDILRQDQEIAANELEIARREGEL